MGLTRVSGDILQTPLNVGVVTATGVNIGTAVTIHTGGFQVGSSSLHSSGLDLGSGNITSHNINSTGIITATSFVGDGTNLTNTGSTLSAASGSQRVVLTEQTSGTMTSSATSASLAFNASTGTLSATKFSGDGSALTGIAGTENVRTNSLVVSGVSTATGGINVGNSFIRSNSIGIGTTTTTGRNAGVGTATGALIYNSTESSIQTYDGSYWAAIGPGSGSGVIKSLGTNITTATQVTLYNVSRRVDGKVYYFNNITFDITSASNNTTAWTQPSNGSYKWSYVYINPSTNQFFVSDTGPSLGNNTATISSQLVVYLFSIYVDDNAFYKFDMNGNHVIITGETLYAGYTWYISGLGMYAASTTQATGTSNYSSYVPTTAAFVKIRINGQWKYRNDSGATVYSVRYFYPRLSDGSGYSDSMLINDTRHWKTPTPTGGYYPITYQVMEHWFSTFEHDFTSVQWGWYFEGYYGDGQTNHGFGMREFIDRAVF